MGAGPRYGGAVATGCSTPWLGSDESHLRGSSEFYATSNWEDKRVTTVQSRTEPVTAGFPAEELKRCGGRERARVTEPQGLLERRVRQSLRCSQGLEMFVLMGRAWRPSGRDSERFLLGCLPPAGDPASGRLLSIKQGLLLSGSTPSSLYLEDSHSPELS